MKHPLQPLIKEADGTIVFQKNAIVVALLATGKLDMNDLMVLPFNQNDREQFAQLIGYSLDRFAELPYVRGETCQAAASQEVNEPEN